MRKYNNNDENNNNNVVEHSNFGKTDTIIGLFASKNIGVALLAFEMFLLLDSSKFSTLIKKKVLKK